MNLNVPFANDHAFICLVLYSRFPLLLDLEARYHLRCSMPLILYQPIIPGRIYNSLNIVSQYRFNKFSEVTHPYLPTFILFLYLFSSFSFSIRKQVVCSQ